MALQVGSYINLGSEPCRLSIIVWMIIPGVGDAGPHVGSDHVDPSLRQAEKCSTTTHGRNWLVISECNPQLRSCDS